MTSLPLSGRIYHEWFSRARAAATADVGEDGDGNGGGRKKYGSAGGREMGGENGQERESRGR